RHASSPLAACPFAIETNCSRWWKSAVDVLVENLDRRDPRLARAVGSSSTSARRTLRTTAAARATRPPSRRREGNRARAGSRPPSGEGNEARADRRQGSTGDELLLDRPQR